MEGALRHDSTASCLGTPPPAQAMMACAAGQLQLPRECLQGLTQEQQAAAVAAWAAVQRSSWFGCACSALPCCALLCCAILTAQFGAVRRARHTTAGQIPFPCAPMQGDVNILLRLQDTDGARRGTQHYALHAPTAPAAAAGQAQRRPQRAAGVVARQLPGPCRARTCSCPDQRARAWGCAV